MRLMLRYWQLLHTRHKMSKSFLDKARHHSISMSQLPVTTSTETDADLVDQRMQSLA